MSHQLHTGLHLVQIHCFVSIYFLYHYSVNISPGNFVLWKVAKHKTMFSNSVALPIVIVDTFVTNYCNMCSGKLFHYALDVFERCTLFDYM